MEWNGKAIFVVLMAGYFESDIHQIKSVSSLFNSYLLKIITLISNVAKCDAHLIVSHRWYNNVINDVTFQMGIGRQIT